MEASIELDLPRRRFVAHVDDSECTLAFTLNDEQVRFDSVQVPEAVGGRGIAGQLTRHALDWAREQDLKVIPRCPYVARWIERHPDYADVVA